MSDSNSDRFEIEGTNFLKKEIFDKAVKSFLMGEAFSHNIQVVGTPTAPHTTVVKRQLIDLSKVEVE